MAKKQLGVWRAGVFNASFLLLTLITLIGIFAAPAIVDLIFTGKGFQDVPLDSSEHFGFDSKRDLTVYLTRIMFPYLILVSLAAVTMGLLNSKGKFGVPASASSFFNVGSLIVGVWGYYIAPDLGLHRTTGMAVGVLAGGALQFLIQVPSMRRVGFRYEVLLSFRDETGAAGFAAYWSRDPWGCRVASERAGQLNLRVRGGRLADLD